MNSDKNLIKEYIIKYINIRFMPISSPSAGGIGFIEKDGFNDYKRGSNRMKKYATPPIKTIHYVLDELSHVFCYECEQIADILFEYLEKLNL